MFRQRGTGPGMLSLSLTLCRGSNSKKVFLTALDGIKCAKVSSYWRAMSRRGLGVQTGRWSLSQSASSVGIAMGMGNEETHYYGDQLNGYSCSVSRKRRGVFGPEICDREGQRSYE